MRFSTHALVSCLVLGLCTTCANNAPQSQVKQPNIIFILADDLGYGELGAYGQNHIETPNIDALAATGKLFTQHYSGAPVCAPARYMLMTGLHAGHAFIRGNDEWRERGEVWNYRAMAQDSSLEGQRPIPDDTKTLAARLQAVGYTTGLVGKWGLGAPHTNAIPNKKGFDYFYGYNCQRQAHTLNPLHLWENEHRVHLNNDTVPPGTKLADGADPNDPGSYASFEQADYAPGKMFERLTNFVAQNAQQPFFLYWATPIPHVPIQAPRAWVDYYRDKFGTEEPYLGQKGYFPHPSPRAGYAAMVSYLDENIGKLVAQLKAEGIYEQTLIIFTSDNGPSYAGGTDSPWFNSGGPFESVYGRGKGFVYEGGIRVPMIASWPGQIAAGSRSALPSTHYDLLPTLLELVGAPVPKDIDGISYLPTLLDTGTQKEHEFLYWEFPEYGGQVAIRMGDWKLVRRNLKSEQESPTLELYNLAVDSIESNNLAQQQSGILSQMAQVFQREHENPSTERFRIPLIEHGLFEE